MSRILSFVALSKVSSKSMDNPLFFLEAAYSVAGVTLPLVFWFRSVAILIHHSILKMINVVSFVSNYDYIYYKCKSTKKTNSKSVSKGGKNK